MTAPWPFAQPENTAVLTLTRVMQGGRPILYVVRDADGDWQFLDGEDVEEKDALVVALQQMVAFDSSIGALSDLPTGWDAEREAVGQPWRRSKRE